MSLDKESPKLIPGQIKAVMEQFPSWIFVDQFETLPEEQKKDSGIVELSNVELFFATQQPHYHWESLLRELTSPFLNLKRALNQGEFWLPTAEIIWSDPKYMWGLMVATELIANQRIEDSTTSTLLPMSLEAKEVLSTNTNTYTTSVQTFPVTRDVTAHFLPSIPLAALVATTRELAQRGESRGLKLLDQDWVGEGIHQPDYQALLIEPRYVQTLANKALQGYTVPGLRRD